MLGVVSKSGHDSLAKCTCCVAVVCSIIIFNFTSRMKYHFFLTSCQIHQTIKTFSVIALHCLGFDSRNQYTKRRHREKCCEQRRSRPACTNVQAGLGLCCLPTIFCHCQIISEWEQQAARILIRLHRTLRFY